MKQPNVMREYIARVHEDSVRRIRTRLSCTDPFERDAYSLIDENFVDAIIALTDITMLLLGHEAGAPADPRFDKTRRAVKKIVDESRKESV